MQFINRYCFLVMLAATPALAQQPPQQPAPESHVIIGGMDQAAVVNAYKQLLLEANDRIASMSGVVQKFKVDLDGAHKSLDEANKALEIAKKACPEAIKPAEPKPAAP